MREAIRSGLERAGQLPVGAGYAEVTVGARGQGEALVGFARGELGWHPRAGVALFGYGEGTISVAGPAWAAGLGARVRW